MFFELPGAIDMYKLDIIVVKAYDVIGITVHNSSGTVQPNHGYFLPLNLIKFLLIPTNKSSEINL